MSLLRRLSRFSLGDTVPSPIICIQSLLANEQRSIWPISQDSWPPGRLCLSDVPTDEQVPATFNTVPYTVEHANLLTLPGVVLRKPEQTVGRSQPYVKLELVCPVRRGNLFDTIRVFFKDSLMQRVCTHINANDEVVVKGELQSYRGRLSVQGTDIAFLEKGTGPVPSAEVKLRLKEAQKHDKASTSSLKPLTTCLQLYKDGVDWVAIADQVGVKPSTVLGYLGDCYGDGKDVDIEKLCKDAMLGVSESSEYLEIDVFVNAIKAEVEDVGQGFLSRTKLGDVIKRVKMTAPSEKIDLQEEVCQKRDIGALVYAQARIVHGMMVRGTLNVKGKEAPPPL